MLCTGEELRPYIEAGLDVELPSPAVFIGKWVDGPASIAAFTNWCGHDAEISLWSRGRLSRDFLKRIGRYAFEELGCARVTARVRADNPWAQHLERLGFVREGCLRGGYDGHTDMLIYGIKRGEYRYGE